MSQPPPPLFPDTPTARPPGARATVAGLGVGVAVLLGFVAYAFLAPTTYRTTAQVVLNPLGGKPLTLPSTPPATQRLKTAAMEAETLERAAQILGLGSGNAALAAAKSRLDAALEVHETGNGTFDFSMSAPT